MSKYPYKYKSPEEVFAASEKRMEKWHEEIKQAIIAHLDILDPVQLLPLYQLERAACRDGVSLYPFVKGLVWHDDTETEGEIDDDGELYGKTVDRSVSPVLG